MTCMPRQAMVPFWDVLNHVTGRANVRLHHCERGGGLQMIATRDIGQARPAGALARHRAAAGSRAGEPVRLSSSLSRQRTGPPSSRTLVEHDTRSSHAPHMSLARASRRMPGVARHLFGCARMRFAGPHRDRHRKLSALHATSSREPEEAPARRRVCSHEVCRRALRLAPGAERATRSVLA
jgi:hypothetical protein